MTTNTTHRIQKQILSIRQDGRDNAFARQTELRKRYENEVVPLLEKICDALCPADQWITIDRLDIVLLPMTEQQYSTSWTTTVEKAFRETLSKAIAQAREPHYQNSTLLSQAEAGLQLLTDFLHTGTVSWSYKETQDGSLETLYKTLITNNPEGVRQMLKQGLGKKTFTERLCYQFPDLIPEVFHLLQPGHTGDISAQYQSLKQYVAQSTYPKNKAKAVFLLHYHSLQQLAQRYRGGKFFTGYILRQLSAAWEMPYKTVLHEVLETTKTITAPQHVQNTLQELIREAVADPKETTETTAFQDDVKQLLQEPYRDDNAVKRLKAMVNQLDKAFNVRKNKRSAGQYDTTEATAFRDELRQLLSETEQVIHAAENTKETRFDALKAQLHRLIRHLETLPPETAYDYKKIVEDTEKLLGESQRDDNVVKRLKAIVNQLDKVLNVRENNRETGQHDIAEAPFEGLYLENAGMVILWSFVKPLFEALKLTENHSFIGEAQQYRAVHVLQYLAGEKEYCSEHELALNKLLCGLELDMPIPKEVQLSKAEKEGVNDLIQSAIRHWPAMKNTSVNGFREAFLLREGKLSRNGNDRQLQVAQESYDMLMNTLPWGISLVKLPWMPGILYVEWPY